MAQSKFRELAAKANSEREKSEFSKVAEKSEQVAVSVMSEASVGNREEKIAVAFASQRNHKHAKNQKPSLEVQKLVDEIIEGKIPDNSQGATHWYSPRSMPKEGQPEAGFDTKGGLEKTEGLSTKNYKPLWAIKLQQIRIPGVRDAYFKFYK